MKRLYMATMMAVLCTLSAGAHAWGYEKLEIDGKQVRISGVKAGDEYGDYVIQPKDTIGGIYVVAAWNLGSKNILPNTTAVIRQYLASKGFNIADKLEGASMAIRFSVDGANCDEGIAQGADNSGSVVANGVIGAGVANAIGGTTAGMTMLLGSGGRPRDVIDLELTGHIVLHPIIDPMSDEFTKNIQHSDRLVAHYTTKDKSTTADVLKIMTDQWIKHYTEQK